jgi:hypothetical protein
MEGGGLEARRIFKNRKNTHVRVVASPSWSGCDFLRDFIVAEWYCELVSWLAKPRNWRLVFLPPHHTEHDTIPVLLTDIFLAREDPRRRYVSAAS